MVLKINKSINLILIQFLFSSFIIVASSQELIKDYIQLSYTQGNLVYPSGSELWQISLSKDNNYCLAACNSKIIKYRINPDELPALTQI
jgi:uncharacterized membrane protein YkvI